MTQEEKGYEQKYKEALIWMQSLYKGLHGATKEDAEHYFPELKESEGERIRKAIIAYINYEQHCGVSNADMIAWLEKQGKKVDADKVIEWLECDAFQSWGEPIDIRPIIRKFKKDFEI